MNQNKLSQYFFIIAAVVAILDGAFVLDSAMQSIKFFLLVFAGIVVGALRHHDQKEFLLSGLAVIITGFILTEILSGTLASFSTMIYNFVIFLSAAIVVVGIEQIANIITFEHEEEQTHTQDIKKFKKLSPQEIKHLTFEHIWGIIILVAVALTFIVLLAQSFFNVSAYADILLAVELLITILFIIDVVILYEKAKNFSEFIHRNIFDIIAAIPAVGVLRGLKLIRAVRIIRVMGKSMKITKMSKLYKTTKFFSEESYFNKLEQQELEKKQSAKKPKQKRNSKVKTKPRSKARSSVKTVSIKKKTPKKTSTRTARKTSKKSTRKTKKKPTKKGSLKKKSAKTATKRKR